MGGATKYRINPAWQQIGMILFLSCHQGAKESSSWLLLLAFKLQHGFIFWPGTPCGQEVLRHSNFPCI
jgi:hypothetical protein